MTSVAAGDRVVVPFQISCGECERCLAGLTGDCRAVRPGSMYGFGAFGGEWGGLLSDLVRVPFADAMLVPLPAGIAPRPRRASPTTCPTPGARSPARSPSSPEPTC